MKYILIATDFSKNSLAAVRYALNLFGSVDVRYTLLNTYADPASSSTTFVSIADQLEKDSLKQLEELKSELLKEFGVEYRIQTKAAYGSLFSVINHLHNEDVYDFLFIGATGAGTLESILIGSNTLDVLKKVEIPTIIVPPNFKRYDAQIVVFANDNRGIADGVCDPLLKIVSEKKSMLRIVHVQQTENKATNLDSLNGIFSTVAHNFEVIQGESVSASLTDYVESEQASMLAMVTRKYGFFEKMVHKSVTKEMSLLGICPILLLHDVE